ncbi:alpha/beta fold hydrolase [Methanobrevibacter sp.]|uniref:alpha/beta fold hydrolase n=1 Tax=Methanobrevibacter sp. TaxID=66852 RepID=UPI0025F43810|nr:alpha/beta hydrolase [Methanobrevibacter sp.]MBR4448203.1 alpha/beta hydrolase [Methanobrevibacter sp.]
MNYGLDGNGKTLIFIHGLSDSLLYWEFFVNNLKHDYQVLRVDLRGHGESELGNEEITIDTYVNDLNNLLEELDISEVNLIGFSLGGAVALDFAIKYSQKVDSIVLMSSFYKVDEALRSTLNQFKNSLNLGFEEFYDNILPMVLCPEVIDDNKKELELLKDMASQNANIEAYIKAVDVCLNFNVEKHVSQINVPTLILAGKYDEISTLDMQKELQKRIGNSKLIVFDNTKHNLLVGKNNEKILAILKEFF